ncbi:MAG: glycosyltransferase [Alphaproteobacteria bacterium]|nr:glycosyltransferase [Alphaproteobacteria bacterium]
MRLLHIMAGRGVGGAETYAVDMILSLHKAGVDQSVVMSRKAPRYQEVVDAGVRTAPEVLSWPFRPLRRFLLSRLIKEEQPELIHCWMRRAAGIIPRKLPGGKRPVIGWFGGYYNPRNFSRCTDFVGVTRDIVAHMVKCGVRESRASFIPTFPDIKPLSPIDRASLNTPEDAPVLLTLSRLHPKKGLDTMLRALALLPGAYLWMAGEGPIRRELEAMAEDLGLSERVRFLGWRNDRAALLRAADVCVLPSRYEPFGTVILEAWAAETPLVACKSAGPAAHVIDGVNGLLVPIDDSVALAEALQKAIGDKDLRELLVKNGYDTYLKDYTREAVTARMLELYQKLIDFHKRFQSFSDK